MQLFNFTWMVLVCTALTLKGQAPATTAFGTNKITRAISLDECIRMAIVRNLAIQIGRSEPEVARYVASATYGYFDPQFSSRASDGWVENPGGFNETFGGITPGSSTRRHNFSADFNGVLPGPTGTRYNLGGDLSKTYGDVFRQVGTNFFVERQGTQYSTGVGGGITQPLLRDFWIDAGRTDIKLAQKDLRISELQLEFLIMQTLTGVAKGYYDLIAARDNIKVQQQAVELAEQLVREEKRRVEVGTKAPLDEKQAESQAALARASLIAAIFEAEKAEDTLKGAITDDFVALTGTTLEPTEKLMAVFQSVSELQSWQNGIQFRPDYQQTKIDIEKANIQLQYRHNQLFPMLDLEFTYALNSRDVTLDGSFDQITDARFPTYGGAVVLRFPLTFRSERNSYKIAKVNKRTAILQLKSLEESIVREIGVAVKAIRSAYAATVSTREAAVFAAAALDAEQKKLDNGKSTSFEVLRLQRDLTQARSDEIRALTAYNRALFDLYFQEGTALQRMKIDLELK